MAKRCHPWISLVLIAALLLPGCSTLPKSSTERPPLKVEYTLWEGDYTLLIAQEKGFFEKHGVQVEPVFYETFSRAVPDLAGKRIDMGLFAIGDLLTASQVADVRGIAVYDSGGTSSVMSRPEIEDIASLKGKKIGVNIGSNGEMFVRQMLKSASLNVNDVTLVEMDPELIPENLTKHAIDAGYTWAPYDKKAQKAGNKVLYTNNEVGALFPDVITIRRELLEDRPEDVRAFLAAWFEAVDYRLKNQAECDQIIAWKTNQSIDEVATTGTLKLYTRLDNLGLYDPISQAGKGNDIYKTSRVNLDFQIASGHITSKPDLATLLDPKYLP
jgi:NitT/TauT family transport system substrate-binding protein